MLLLFSGGTNITVSGTQLNAVQEPRLLVYSSAGSVSRRSVSQQMPFSGVSIICSMLYMELPMSCDTSTLLCDANVPVM